jgi:small subunit ribosomal protein S20
MRMRHGRPGAADLSVAAKDVRFAAANQKKGMALSSRKGEPGFTHNRRQRLTFSIASVYESAALSRSRACAPDFLRSRSSMANTKSAEKATRQMVRRTEINKSRTSRMRAFVRKVEEAIASGDKDAAKAAMAAAEPILMRSAQKQALHKRAASRKISRLNARLRAMP